ncbi:MAG: response regulator transcription factor [Saprospiraceae bacterium]|nr:response regulator transcription factor [Saprospiraceae bacterium]
MEKILIVEDDPHIAELVALHLTDAGCQVTIENDGLAGHDRALRETFNLIILDINLPKMTGLDICKAVRKHRKYVPIMMMTAKSEENDIVMGLEVGADDYITKPFSVKELVARVKAVLRRTQAMNSDLAKSGKVLQYDGLTIDTENRTVILRGERVDLTPKEYDLLYVLAKKPGRSFSRQQLLDAVWGYEFEGLEHTVNSHVNRLRIKIEKDVQNPIYILTTWGVGYRFNDDI